MLPCRSVSHRGWPKSARLPLRRAVATGRGLQLTHTRWRARSTKPATRNLAQLVGTTNRRRCRSTATNQCRPCQRQHHRRVVCGRPTRVVAAGRACRRPSFRLRKRLWTMMGCVRSSWILCLCRALKCRRHGPQRRRLAASGHGTRATVRRLPRPRMRLRPPGWATMATRQCHDGCGPLRRTVTC